MLKTPIIAGVPFPPKPASIFTICFASKPKGSDEETETSGNKRFETVTIQGKDGRTNGAASGRQG